MPYRIIHHPHSHLVSLINTDNAKIYAKATSLERAKKQIQAIEINKKKKEKGQVS